MHEMDSLGSENHRLLMIYPSPEDEERLKDQVLRLRDFADWMTDRGLRWDAPDLKAYERHLYQERELLPSSVKAHLSTIRGRYRKLMRENIIQTQLLRLAPGTTQDERREFVSSTVAHIQREIKPGETFTRTQRRETEYLTLSREMASELLRRPGIKTKSSWRDTAIIAVFLGTGIRPIELVGLHYEHIIRDGDYRAKPVLHVPPCRGCDERLVPYLNWRVLDIVEAWLREAHIKAGPVFSGFYRGENVRDTPLSRRAVEQILNSYPIDVGGLTITVNSMDLRRTYARWLYESGEDLRTIRHNLGLKSLDTVEKYIGDAKRGHYEEGFDKIFNLSPMSFEW
jgi:site-specific recombinase XerD